MSDSGFQDSEKKKVSAIITGLFSFLLFWVVTTSNSWTSVVFCFCVVVCFSEAGSRCVGLASLYPLSSCFKITSAGIAGLYDHVQLPSLQDYKAQFSPWVCSLFSRNSIHIFLPKSTSSCLTPTAAWWGKHFHFHWKGSSELLLEKAGVFYRRQYVRTGSKPRFWGSDWLGLSTSYITYSLTDRKPINSLTSLHLKYKRGQILFP